MLDLVEVLHSQMVGTKFRAKWSNVAKSKHGEFKSHERSRVFSFAIEVHGTQRRARAILSAHNWGSHRELCRDENDNARTNIARKGETFKDHFTEPFLWFPLKTSFKELPRPGCNGCRLRGICRADLSSVCFGDAIILRTLSIFRIRVITNL